MAVLIDGNNPSMAEQLRANKDGAKLSIAAKIANDVSASPQAMLQLASNGATQAGEAVAQYAIAIASRIVDAFSPEVR